MCTGEYKGKHHEGLGGRKGSEKGEKVSRKKRRYREGRDNTTE